MKGLYTFNNQTFFIFLFIDQSTEYPKWKVFSLKLKKIK
jgi:hypothetical protein